MDSREQKWLQELRTLDEPLQNNEEDDTIWLISYADLMTLLFTFFVMLYSTSIIDDGRSLRKALMGYVQKYAPQNSTTPPASGGLESVKAALHEEIETDKVLKDIQLDIRTDTLEVTFSSSLLFNIGQYELRPDFYEPLKKIAKIIQQNGPDYKIRIEGHTDDLPISNMRFKSNWELSAARAANIAAFLEQNGFDTKNLTAIGYSSSRPVAHNRTPAGTVSPEGQKLNRRVVITVYK